MPFSQETSCIAAKYEQTHSQTSVEWHCDFCRNEREFASLPKEIKRIALIAKENGLRLRKKVW